MSTQPQQQNLRSQPHQVGRPDPTIGLDPRELNELLRAGLEQAIPFNLHNDVRISEVSARGGIAELPDAQHLKNHLGTQHGGALFAVAEAAAGAAYVGAFSEHLAEIRMNAQEAHITYMRWARGQITAKSSLGRQPQEILEDLRAYGRVDLKMSCTLYDAENQVVAKMTFRFQLKRVRMPTQHIEPKSHQYL